jgi:hypothetical protein
MIPMNPYSCERTCRCHPPQGTEFIVITGGPGAGKTALIEILRKILCQHVAVLPEAASILFGGGFWRLKSSSARESAQRAIYHVQNEMQSLVAGEKKWVLALCDRGTLDGKAYWPGNPDDYAKSLVTSETKEYAKYVAVIHLSSPSLQNGYNYTNPLRIESPEEAMAIDEKIHEVWKNHPNYNRIESTDNFIEKVEKATQLICAFLPKCCKDHLNQPHHEE